MTAERPAAILGALNRDLSTSECAELDALLKVVEPNALARAAGLWVRKREWDRQHPESRRGGDRRSRNFRSTDPDQTANFAVWSAEALGLAERTVRDDVQLAEEIGVDHIKALWPTQIAGNAAHLKVFAGLETPLRARLLAAIEEDGQASFAACLARAGLRPTIDPEESFFRTVAARLANASLRTLRRIRDLIDAEIRRRSGGGKGDNNQQQAA